MTKKITTDYFCDDCGKQILSDNGRHNEYYIAYLQKDVHLCHYCLLARLSHSFSIIEDLNNI